MGTLVLLVQLLGAMFIGFATLNWMNRGAHIGGIHRRPVSMANFSHFAIGAVALVKGAVARDFATEVTAIATVYAMFGVWFGLVLFVNSQPGRSL